MRINTPDLCDNYPELIRVVDPLFTNYGVKVSFGGEIVSIKCFEDNSVVKQASEINGNGKVIVVDAEASMRFALFGDLIAEDATKNCWPGEFVYVDNNGIVVSATALEIPS